MKNQASRELKMGTRIYKIRERCEQEKDYEQAKEVTVQKFLSQEISQMLGAAIITTDTSGKILFLNTLAEKLTGFSCQVAQSLPLSRVFKIVHEVTYSALEDPLEKVLYGEQALHFSDNALLVKANNNHIPIEYSASPIYDADQIVGTVLVFQDLSSFRKANYQEIWQPTHDSLTGLVSRSSFENCLEQALYDAKTMDRSHVLCYLDLDRFKIINEVCGHLAGDELLRQFSTVLKKRIRKTDVLARLGGDEFGLILHDCNLEQALNVLQTLHKEVRKIRFPWQSYTFNITFSAGVTLLHADSENSSSVLLSADSACSIAKEKGRDRIKVYQTNDQDVTAHRGGTNEVLRVIKALEEDQFLLYCQPIVPVASSGQPNNQHSFEILIRLQDEQGKFILPGEFLPAAERYGLIHLVDRWVIQNLFKALSQNQAKSKALLHESFQETSFAHCYSINLSGSSFNDDQFLEFIQEQFAIYRIPPELICFEITETVAIDSLDKAAKLIAQLREIGCRFALDDFGSGMSSFSYLRSLPIDYIKIDGTFIKEMTQNPIAYEIVKSINSIGHAMNIQTTAEFVENEEILEILKSIGVDYMQGYGIAKPFPLKLS